LNKDLQLSSVIAGTLKWGVRGAKFSKDEYLRLIENCLEIELTSFDHADIYGNYTTEEEFGNALRMKPHLRQQLQLITKCGIRMVSSNRPENKIKSYDTSKEHIIASAERSLKNLNTDYLDLLLLHRPDPLMDPDEIAAAFARLKQEGKVLHFGVSNFSPSQTEMILSRFPIISNQVEISILHLQPFLDGTLDQCITRKLIPMAWSPLGGGNIFASLDDERNIRITAVAQFLAEAYNAGPDQVLLSWLIRHPSGIYPVLGTSKLERIKAALDATRIILEREEWFLLWRASTGYEVP
jgi:predicted oxidoreductase